MSLSIHNEPITLITNFNHSQINTKLMTDVLLQYKISHYL